MLPNKQQIQEKALELWHQHQFKNGDPSFAITPTLAELRENGFLSLAQSELMRDNARAQSEEWVGYNEHVAKYDSSLTYNFGIPFDIEEQEDSNNLITGANKTGKSRLACGIASVLQTFDWKIRVFDNVGIWKKISDIPVFYMITKRNYDKEEKEWVYPFPETSMIFDMSLLKPIMQKKFVDSVLEKLWNKQVKNGSRWTLIILEEFQLYGRNIRGSAAQNILRIMSAGRNHKIRVLAITVDLALIDTVFIRLCSQRYYGRLSIEENSKRKFRNYHGLDWCRIATELDLGFFIYLVKDKLQVVNVPCFETKRISVAHNNQRLVAKSA